VCSILSRFEIIPYSLLSAPFAAQDVTQRFEAVYQQTLSLPFRTLTLLTKSGSKRDTLGWLEAESP
jgi:hypothetical protein